MEVTVLETIGTLGAGGGGIAGLYLLGRGMWRMWSGQLEEQRRLLADSRQGSEQIIEERDRLREQLRVATAEHDRQREQWHSDLHTSHVKRRKWAEYASELRRELIESGVPVKDLPEYPTTRSIPTVPPQSTSQEELEATTEACEARGRGD